MPESSRRFLFRQQNSLKKRQRMRERERKLRCLWYEEIPGLAEPIMQTDIPADTYKPELFLTVQRQAVKAYSTICQTGLPEAYSSIYFWDLHIVLYAGQNFRKHIILYTFGVYNTICQAYITICFNCGHGVRIITG